MTKRFTLGLWLSSTLVALALWPGHANAETQTVRIAKQYGISYLPLTIMEAKHLLEGQGKKLGLDLKSEWIQFTGGPPMNEAIISGNLEFASGGVGPLLTIWGKTRGALAVRWRISLARFGAAAERNSNITRRRTGSSGS